MPNPATRPTPAGPAGLAPDAGRPQPGWPLRAPGAVYRFLASLKLAVISLSSLAGVLAYATFFEKWYGTAAVQDWIYQSPLFSLLLAFLGINILCAALIRFPWTKRQTGFVITHAGLIIVLIGSWISMRVTDDGQVGMVEGEQSSQLVRIDDAAIRVQPIDREKGVPTTEFQLPFYPGTFTWNPAEPAAATATGGLGAPVAYGLASGFAAALVSFGVLWGFGRFPRVKAPVAYGTMGALGLAAAVCLGARERGPRQDLLTTPAEPFQLLVKQFYPASSPVKYAPREGDGGEPMIRAALFLKMPSMGAEMDVIDRFDDGRGAVPWLKADNPRYRRDARSLGPALLTFQLAERPEMVEDFLALPEKPLEQDQVRVHYKGKAGKAQVFTIPAGAKEGASFPLPESDGLTVTLTRRANLPLGPDVDPDGTMGRVSGEEELAFVFLDVKQGDRPAEPYIACSALPALPNNPRAADPPVRISYYHPPRFGEGAMQGRSAVVEVLGTREGKLFYRAFGRDGLRGKGPLEVGKRVQLVGGANQPVTFSLKVDEYLTSGVDGEVVQEMTLPPNQKDQGIPGALVQMSANGQTKEFWLRRPGTLSPTFQTVAFPDGSLYRVALDFDRKDLDFSLKLTNFEVGMDPGTNQPSSFSSEVLLTDERRDVTDRPIRISMNEPLTYRDYTFYQSNYDRVRDKATGRPTGQFMSIFQVRYDPDWCWGTVYLGCLLVCLGTFVQFYMRAGLFSDGGKRERERSERTPPRAGEPNGQVAPEPAEPVAAAPRRPARAARRDDELL
jgi:hypothetical protein